MSDTHPIREDGTCCSDYTKSEELIADILNMESGSQEYFDAVREFTRCVADCPRRLRDPRYQDVIALLAMRGHIHTHIAA